MIYNKTKNISFPIGGIGTGCIGLYGNGEINDWEILNHPWKSTYNGYSHFAIKAVCKDKTVAKVLHGDTNQNLIGVRDPAIPGGFDFGPRILSMVGFPHFKNVQFDGTFPIANLLFSDEDFPAKVRLCAFNPFIPHDYLNSSLPAGFFEWEIENTSDEEIEYAISFSVCNVSDSSENEPLENGCFLHCANKQNNEIGYCDLTVLTDNKDNVVQAYWYRGEWQDSVITYWKNFTQYNRMPERTYPNPAPWDHASVVAYVSVKAKEKKKVRFVLSWNTPVQYNYWSPLRDENGKDVTWKNYYATVFENSTATAKYALSNFDELLSKTKQFTQALYSSSMPDYVVDAVSANLSVLKSPTVMRLEDGSFWGWEGVHDRVGLCEGSCQHVWNYAYALPFLFPQLERSMRENTIKYGMKENGQTTARIQLPMGKRSEFSRTCIDGHMGEIIKFYREWKISGDDEWLKKNAESVFKMIEYAWDETNTDAWDINCDGVIEGRQHHTLDMELFSENSWIEGLYLLALDCAYKMADFLGDKKRAEKYKLLYSKGKTWTNENLFNGEYFGQIIDIKDKSVLEKFPNSEHYWYDEGKEIKYQIGEGCIIDQMLADWHSAIIGVGEVFDSDKKKTALKSLYKYNYKPSMREVTNAFRNFAVNDEAGTIICDYPPHKQCPAMPILYLDETMTGFEYALAGLMLSQGFINEGQTIVKAVRDRYDGEKRNPWSELECGHNYARSMASYSLLLIYSGFSFDMTENYIGFKPISDGDCNFFWSVCNTYGTMQIKEKEETVTLLGDKLTLSSFGLRNNQKVNKVLIDGNTVEFIQKEDRIYFSKTEINSTLKIVF